MAAERKTNAPLIVIVGPTASGKTTLAITLAKKFGGEIICADSRTVYKRMDIGTAKPTAGEQAAVPHWGLNLVEPGERFTAVDFKQYAEQKISEIRARGRIPFLVGGTGLYIDTITFDYQFGPEVDKEQREQLEKMSLEELYEYCKLYNIDLPENSKNKRYIIRAVEREGMVPKRQMQLVSNSLVVGITTQREVLRTRIADRTEQLFQNGVVEEATILGKKYGWRTEAMTGNIYRLAKAYLEGEYSLTEFKHKVMAADWKLAKRQLTWLRRNPYIKWLELSRAEQDLTSVLAKYK